MGHRIRIAGLTQESIVDGPGIRFVIFTQGCRHQCPGCHNPQTHSFAGGVEMEISEILQQIKGNPLLDGVTLSGGDPFEQGEACAALAKEVRALGLHVITYTGYRYETILENLEHRPGWKELLAHSHWLVDGKFDQRLKSPYLRFVGSANQRIIDLEETRAHGEPVYMEIYREDAKAQGALG